MDLTGGVAEIKVLNSNTTLVKVKFSKDPVLYSTMNYSNTTLVKVKYKSIFFVKG